MALPEGIFSGGSAGITHPGGSWSYVTGVTLPQYFAGPFFIDTGYDDPVSWAAGIEAAEVYQARVYGATGTVSTAPAGGTYTGKWMISPVPVWSSKFWAFPHSNQVSQQRVLIKCDVWLAEPFDTASGAWQRLESVSWTLYRV